jgi:hypothetical protein
MNFVKVRMSDGYIADVNKDAITLVVFDKKAPLETAYGDKTGDIGCFLVQMQGARVYRSASNPLDSSDTREYRLGLTEREAA